MANQRLGGGFIPPAPNLVGRTDPLVQKAFQDLSTQIQDLHARVTGLPKPQAPDYGEIARQLTQGGSAPLNLQGLLGVLSAPQRASVTLNTQAPSGIVAQPGTITLINGVLSYFDTTSIPGAWLPVGAIAVFYQDTHANRLSLAKYSASKLPIGAAFWETDRHLLYLNQGTYGSSAWKYVLGTVSDAQASLTGLSLGTSDTGVLVWVTDFAHMLQWSGTGFAWGPGDSKDAGQGPIPFEVDPSPTTGWHLYDGTTGVQVLKSDGTVITVNLPNLSGSSPSQVYTKSGVTNVGVTSASAPTFAGSLTTVPSNTTTESVGHTHAFAGTTFAQPYATGTAVVVPVSPSAGESNTHTHPIPALTVTGTGAVGSNGEPANITRRMWLRQ